MVMNEKINDFLQNLENREISKFEKVSLANLIVKKIRSGSLSIDYLKSLYTNPVQNNINLTPSYHSDTDAVVALNALESGKMDIEKLRELLIDNSDINRNIDDNLDLEEELLEEHSQENSVVVDNLYNNDMFHSIDSLTEGELTDFIDEENISDDYTEDKTSDE